MTCNIRIRTIPLLYFSFSLHPHFSHRRKREKEVPMAPKTVPAVADTQCLSPAHTILPLCYTRKAAKWNGQMKKKKKRNNQ